MKKSLLYLFAGLMVIGYASSAPALTLVTNTVDNRAAITELEYVGADGFVNSGNFIGVFTGNDSNQQDQLQNWLRTDGGYGVDFILNEYFKDEYSDNEAAKSGEWLTDADIMFYIVKAADAFALYAVTPLASSGTWSTYNLWTHGYGGNGGIEISHVSGYNTAPVPEPATMLLLGTGLVGLASIGRKRLKK